ncbi:hypothetical protein CEUSTIGMA_g10276.t1 [Chlamydomonas eustigma]|uniref:Protein kinase domain-containing protein n=1 Tax=Chlamydomonas eustigma TaxID=1157962 RepID=A0A250XJ76_9CHLO|nr:hypothetical protein CEUSTIGMA_g10276.t1 [Chlamydomonas eustigma]|eukprot:GAX82850.1 hypothetical protein CEUSTIGMA_g10276.t1 [Chlamydomonas eustigma]
MVTKTYELKDDFLLDGLYMWSTAICNDKQQWIIKRVAAPDLIPCIGKVESQMFNEGIITCKLQHPCMLIISDAVVTQYRPILIYEPCAYTLPHIQQLWNRTGIPIADVKRLMYQIVSAVAYMHERDLCHQGLRPQCMMVQENGLLKIGGFEHARPLPKNNAPESQQKAETMSIYSAPEVILKISNGRQADVWAIGCICAELLAGFPLFEGESDADVLWSISKLVGVCPRHVSVLHEREDCHRILDRIAYSDPEKFKKRFSQQDRPTLRFLEKCLNTDPTRRASVKDLLKHDFFNDIPKDLTDMMEAENQRVRTKWDMKLRSKVLKYLETEAGNCLVAAEAAAQLRAREGFGALPPAFGSYPQVAVLGPGACMTPPTTIVLADSTSTAKKSSIRLVAGPPGIGSTTLLAQNAAVSQALPRQQQPLPLVSGLGASGNGSMAPNLGSFRQLTNQMPSMQTKTTIQGALSVSTPLDQVSEDLAAKAANGDSGDAESPVPVAAAAAAAAALPPGRTFKTITSVRTRVSELQEEAAAAALAAVTAEGAAVAVASPTKPQFRTLGVNKDSKAPPPAAKVSSWLNTVDLADMVQPSAEPSQISVHTSVSPSVVHIPASMAVLPASSEVPHSATEKNGGNLRASAPGAFLLNSPASQNSTASAVAAPHPSTQVNLKRQISLATTPPAQQNGQPFNRKMSLAIHPPPAAAVSNRINGQQALNLQASVIVTPQPKAPSKGLLLSKETSISLPPSNTHHTTSTLQIHPLLNRTPGTNNQLQPQPSRFIMQPPVTHNQQSARPGTSSATSSFCGIEEVSPTKSPNSSTLQLSLIPGASEVGAAVMGSGKANPIIQIPHRSSSVPLYSEEFNERPRSTSTAGGEVASTERSLLRRLQLNMVLPNTEASGHSSASQAAAAAAASSARALLPQQPLNPCWPTSTSQPQIGSALAGLISKYYDPTTRDVSSSSLQVPSGADLEALPATARFLAKTRSILQERTSRGLLVDSRFMPATTVPLLHDDQHISPYPGSSPSVTHSDTSGGNHALAYRHGASSPSPAGAIYNSASAGINHHAVTAPPLSSHVESKPAAELTTHSGLTSLSHFLLPTPPPGTPSNGASQSSSRMSLKYNSVSKSVDMTLARPYPGSFHNMPIAASPSKAGIRFSVDLPKTMLGLPGSGPASRLVIKAPKPQSSAPDLDVVAALAAGRAPSGH